MPPSGVLTTVSTQDVPAGAGLAATGAAGVALLASLPEPPQAASASSGRAAKRGEIFILYSLGENSDAGGGEQRLEVRPIIDVLGLGAIDDESRGAADRIL